MRRGLIVEEEEKEDKSGPSWFVLNRVRCHQLPAFSHIFNQDVTWLNGCLINLAIASFMWFILQLDQYDISRNRGEYRFFMSVTQSLFCTGQSERSSLMSPSSKQKKQASRAIVVSVCPRPPRIFKYVTSHSWDQQLSCHIVTFSRNFKHLSRAYFLCNWAEILICWFQTLRE